MPEAIKSFEKDIIRILCSSTLDSNLIEEVFKYGEVKIDFSGYGYFIEISYNSLPYERIVCNEPFIESSFDGKEVGFLVFIEKHSLTLECHTYGEEFKPQERDATFNLRNFYCEL